MNAKRILIGAGVFTVGYSIGKIVGYAKSVKNALDGIEEIAPGAKEDFVRRVSDAVITSMFKSKNEES